MISRGSIYIPLITWLVTAIARGGVLFTNLYSFSGYSDGSNPLGDLIQASDGNLYGTANYGGYNYFFFGYGTVYRVSISGTFTVLYSFDTGIDAQHPMLSNLTEDSDGTFYGTTAVGGYYHNGTVFNMTPDGFLFPIYEFSQYGSDGTGPSAGVIRGSDGNF